MRFELNLLNRLILHRLTFSGKFFFLFDVIIPVILFLILGLDLDVAALIVVLIMVHENQVELLVAHLDTIVFFVIIHNDFRSAWSSPKHSFGFVE